MFCSQCGKKTSEDARFCRYCGTPQEDDKDMNESGPVMLQSGQMRPQPMPMNPQPGQMRPQPMPMTPQSGQMRPQPMPVNPQPGQIRPQPGQQMRPQPMPMNPQPGQIRPQPGQQMRPQPMPMNPQPGQIRPQPRQQMRPQPMPMNPQPGQTSPRPVVMQQMSTKTGGIQSQKVVIPPQPIADPRQLSPQTPVKRKKKKGRVIATTVIASVLVAVLLVTALWRPGFLMKYMPDSPEKMDLADLIDVPSKCSPKDIEVYCEGYTTEPMDGIEITVPDNAWNQKLEITASSLTDEETYSYAEMLSESTFVALDATEISAGLSDTDVLTEPMKVTMNLKNMNIPKDIWEDLVVVRMDADNNPQLLTTTIDGSKMTFETYQNSVFITGTLLTVMVGSGAYLLKSDLKEKWLDFSEYEGKQFMSTTKVKGYRVTWPVDMGFANPAEVENVTNELDQVFEEYEITSSKIARDIITKSDISTYKESIRAYLKGLYHDPVYKELMEKIKDSAWQEANVWPTEVKVAIRALEIANSYLFIERGFKKTYCITTEVAVLNPWPYGNSDYAYCYNPKLGTPFIHINASLPSIPGTMEQYQNPKSAHADGMNNLLLTLTHELFHVSQSKYVWYDSSSYLWLWEATAVLLEKEAYEYYLKNNGSDGNPCFYGSTSEELVTYHMFYETYGQSMADTQWWQVGEDNKNDIINQAYTAANYLEFLRDRLYKNKKNAFLPEVLKQYASQWSVPGDPHQALNAATINDNEKYHSLYTLFMKNSYEMQKARVTNSALRGSADFFQDFTKEDVEIGSQRQLGITALFSPYTSEIQKFKVDSATLRKDHEYAVAIQTDKYLFEDLKPFYLRYDDGSGQCEVIREELSCFPVTKNKEFFLHSLHSYGNDSTQRNGKYSIYILESPEKPTVRVDNENIFVILPTKSDAAKAGIVGSYELNIGAKGAKKTKTITIPFDMAQGEIKIPVSDFCQAESIMDQVKQPVDEGVYTITVTEIIGTKSDRYGASPVGEVEEFILGLTLDQIVGTYTSTVSISNYASPYMDSLLDYADSAWGALGVEGFSESYYAASGYTTNGDYRGTATITKTGTNTATYIIKYNDASGQEIPYNATWNAPVLTLTPATEMLGNPLEITFTLKDKIISYSGTDNYSSSIVSYDMIMSGTKNE